LLGFKAERASINILEDVSGIIKPCRYELMEDSVQASYIDVLLSILVDGKGTMIMKK
jgi:hypothetical protein